MPENSLDFEILVQFEKTKDHPELVFDSISKLITSFQRIDTISARIINQEIKLSFALEKVESGSIRVKLARFLKSMDDRDIEDLNYKRIVGKALNACRKKAIALLEKPITPELVADTEETFIKEAEKITGKTLIRPSFPKEELLYAVEDVWEAVNSLSEGDAIYCVQDEEEIELKPVSTVYQIENIETRGTRTKQERMILKIKKPDFLGNSKWEFKYENETIRANISDENWLEAFRNKTVKVGPGDALSVIWEYQIEHQQNKPVVVQNYNIIKILEVIRGEYHEQQKLFED